MPDQTLNVSDAYKEWEQKRVVMLEEQKNLGDGKPFSVLDFKQQIEYARYNKRLAENYWQCYSLAMSDQNYQSAARDLVCAFKLDFSKANQLIEESNTDCGSVPEPVVSPSDSPDDLFLIAIRYFLGLGLPQNRVEAVKRFEKLASSGHLDAQYFMGLASDLGKGIKRNSKKSVDWYLLAANRGHALAQYRLGNIHDHNGIYSNSFYWYQKAAEQGVASALNALGYAYDFGQGIVKDVKLAKRNYRLAAGQGNSDGRFNLAKIYSRTTEPSKLAKALDWYLLGAEYGDRMSQFAAGCAYENGDGVEQNPTEAVKWFRHAAIQGHAKALNALGQMNTPPAAYAHALLTSNITELSRLLIKHDELKKEFLEIDFHLPSTDNISIDSLISGLKLAACEPDSNEALIGFLLILDGWIGAYKTRLLNFQLQLLETISLADVGSVQLPRLLQYLCNLAYHVESDLIYHSLIKLCLRMKSLSVSLDGNLCQLIAGHLIRCLFQKKYRLQWDRSFNSEDLWVIVFACTAKSEITAATLNTLLQKNLLIDSCEHPSILLPKLKACIASLQQDKSPILDNLVQAIPDGIADKAQWEAIYTSLQAGARVTLKAAKRPILLNVKLSETELTLLRFLKSGNARDLNDWININQNPVQPKDEDQREHPTPDAPAKRIKVM